MGLRHSTRLASQFQQYSLRGEPEMHSFREVTDNFFVSPQISVEDVETAHKSGFETLIMNRPPGETPDQPDTQAIVDAASGNVMTFFHIPITAPPQMPDVDATIDALEQSAGKKVLAFCRSGTRSVTLWAYAMAKMKSLEPMEIISKAGAAGYDLSPHTQNLQALYEL
ncbi:MAG: TIGR01244 family phosphatase [Ponticaulis sp.]|nr:TIGR01244 family phosphatase [Ponticaulis sp.]